MSERAQNKKAQERRQKLALFERQNGLCFYCKQHMILSFAPPTHAKENPRRATLEHLDHRWSPDRGRHSGEYRRVLACHECNGKRGAEYLAANLERQRRESKRHGASLADGWPEETAGTL